jgi:nucleotide-binding universal stress UspA family protein
MFACVMSWFTSVGRVEVVRPHPRDMLGGQRRVPRLRARVRGWLRVVGEPAAEIVRATLRERVDLVVMGSHKVRPGGRPRGWGTTSYKVGIFCQCPILLVK